MKNLLFSLPLAAHAATQEWNTIAPSHNLHQDLTEEQTKYAKFGAGFLIGGLIEFASHDDSYPCLNESAALALDLQMMWYIYDNRDADDDYIYLIEMLPYIITVQNTAREGICGYTLNDI